MISIDQLIQDQFTVINHHLDYGGGIRSLQSAIDRLGFCGRMWIKMGYKTQTTNLLQKIESAAKERRPAPHQNHYEIDALLSGVDAAKTIFDISY